MAPRYFTTPLHGSQRDYLNPSLMRYLFASLFFLMIVPGIAQKKKMDMTKISLEMSKEQVVDKIGKPENVIGAEKLENGLVEVYQYTDYGPPFGKVVKERYWLYVVDNKLKKWAKPTRATNWKEEAKKL
jgi:replicative DNA helicase